MVLQVLKDQEAHPAFLAATELWAPPGRRAPTEKSVKREPRVPRVKSGLPVPWVLRACKGSRAKLALRGKREPPDPKEKPARTGLQGLRVK